MYKHRRKGKGRIEHHVDILTTKFVGDALRGGMAKDWSEEELVNYCDKTARLVLDIYKEDEEEAE